MLYEVITVCFNDKTAFVAMIIDTSKIVDTTITKSFDFIVKFFIN